LKCPKCGSTSFTLKVKESDSAYWDEEEQKLVIYIGEPEYLERLSQLYDEVRCQECDTVIDWSLVNKVDWEFR